MPENAESLAVQILSAGSIVLTLFASVLLIILMNNSETLDRSARLGLRLMTGALFLFAAWMLVQHSAFAWAAGLRPILAVAASLLLPGGVFSLSRAKGLIAGLDDDPGRETTNAP